MEPEKQPSPPFLHAEVTAGADRHFSILGRGMK
jgi:hypothetical protein